MKGTPPLLSPFSIPALLSSSPLLSFLSPASTLRQLHQPFSSALLRAPCTPFSFLLPWHPHPFACCCCCGSCCCCTNARKGARLLSSAARSSGASAIRESVSNVPLPPDKKASKAAVSFLLLLCKGCKGEGGSWLVCATREDYKALETRVAGAWSRWTYFLRFACAAPGPGAPPPHSSPVPAAVPPPPAGVPTLLRFRFGIPREVRQSDATTHGMPSTALLGDERGLRHDSSAAKNC